MNKDDEVPEEDRVAEPHENDVLCGHGVKYFGHPGNFKLRKFISKEVLAYASATNRQEKSIIVKTTTAAYLQTGGRFLRLHPSGKFWVNGHDEAGHLKVGHAFRDIMENRTRWASAIVAQQFIVQMHNKTRRRSKGGEHGQLGRSSRNSGVKHKSLSSMLSSFPRPKLLDSYPSPPSQPPGIPKDELNKKRKRERKGTSTDTGTDVTAASGVGTDPVVEGVNRSEENSKLPPETAFPGQDKQQLPERSVQSQNGSEMPPQFKDSGPMLFPVDKLDGDNLRVQRKLRKLNRQLRVLPPMMVPPFQANFQDNIAGYTTVAKSASRQSKDGNGSAVASTTDLSSSSSSRSIGGGGVTPIGPASTAANGPAAVPSDGANADDDDNNNDDDGDKYEPVVILPALVCVPLSALPTSYLQEIQAWGDVEETISSAKATAATGGIAANRTAAGASPRIPKPDPNDKQKKKTNAAFVNQAQKKQPK